ncbi:MAG: O-antigen ligase family protein, partial [Bacteroidota bacterium]
MPLQLRIWVFLSGLLIITPLIFWPDLVEYYLTPRFLFLSGWLFIGLLFFYVRAKGSKSLRIIHALDFSILGFYVWQLASSIWAPNIGEALFTAQRTQTLLLTYFFIRVLYAVKPKETERTLIWSNFGISLIFVGYVTWEIFAKASETGFSNEALYAVTGPSGNKSLLTEYLFLLLPFNFLGSHKLNRKTLFGTLIVYQMFLILILQTRTVYLALLLCGLIFLIFRLRQPEGRRWFKEKLIPIIGALAIGVVGVIFSLGGISNFINRINPANWLSSDTAKERAFVWEKTVGLISENWLIGVGSGGWKIKFPSQGVGGSWRLDSQNVVFTRTHNDFLEVFAETGIIGLSLFISIFVFALYAGWKAYSKAQDAQRKSVLVVFLGTLGFVVISFFDFPKERMEHTMLFGVFLGYLAYQGRAALKPRAIKTQPREWFPVFVGLMAAALAFNINMGFNRFNGERHVLMMLRAKKSQLPELMAQEARHAESYFYTLDPMVVPLSYYEGLEFYQQQNWEQAAMHFFEAYAKNPYNFHVVNNLATTLTQMQRYP